METFKIWLMSLCGATAVSSVFKLLLSESSLKKVINVFFSIFILFYTVMPAQSFFKDNKNINIESSDFVFDEYYQDGYEAIITQAITNLCNEMTAEVLSIEIDSYIDNDGYLNVNKIVIKVNSQNPQNIKDKIKEELGFEVEVE